VLGESKKNFFKILYFSSVELDPFVFEHFDFSLYSGSRCLSLKSPNPTGCGNNPVSGNLWRIGVSSHGLPDSPIRPGFQGMGYFLIGRYTPFRHLPQYLVRFFGKCFHFPLSYSENLKVLLSPIERKRSIEAISFQQSGERYKKKFITLA
jgi:hypothetical protein